MKLEDVQKVLRAESAWDAHSGERQVGSCHASDLMIATCEAEMNLIVFTDGGRIVANIEPAMIRLVVKDDGPGIPDVDQAMQPGFSTAPDWVRELGFGAGMGLNNIETCADRMDLDSKVGTGTRLEVDILLERDGESERDS